MQITMSNKIIKLAPKIYFYSVHVTFGYYMIGYHGYDIQYIHLLYAIIVALLSQSDVLCTSFYDTNGTDICIYTI